MLISEHLPQMAKVMDKATVVRSLAHTIPSHGPATVFMTTGNKPTAALQYPAMGSLCARLMTVDKGVPPYVSFQDLRNGAAGGAGYLGAAYNPFGVEGGGGGGKGGGGGNMRVRGITLMGSDGCGDQSKFDGFRLALAVTEEADARKIFDALANGGSVQMPLCKTFWSPCYGMVTDRFGVGWMVMVPGPTA